jgi:hypothetical protein
MQYRLDKSQVNFSPESSGESGGLVCYSPRDLDKVRTSGGWLDAVLGGMYVKQGGME